MCSNPALSMDKFGIPIAFSTRMMRASSLWLLLCLIWAPAGCQIREKGDLISEPEKRTLEWFAHVVPEKDGYGVRLDWTPAVPATFTRYVKSKESGKWEKSGHLEVAEIKEPRPIWKAEKDVEEYRLTIEVNDPKIDITNAPRFIYVKIPKDMNLIGEERKFIKSDEPLIVGKATTAEDYLFDVILGKATDPKFSFEFYGGVFQMYSESLEFPRYSTIHFRQDEKMPAEKFEFTMKSQKTSGGIMLEIGPFDPKGPTPVIDIDYGYSSLPIQARAMGQQHPDQKVRICQYKECFYFVGGKIVPLSDYEGLYQPNPQTRKPGERYLMVAKNGKVYRFSQRSNGDSYVMDDAEFYPSDVDFVSYEKLNWGQKGIPYDIQRVREIIDEVEALQKKWLYYVSANFNLTSLYEHLPDHKQVDVVKEINNRAQEIKKLLILTGTDQIYISNIPTQSPEVSFMRRDILHSIGIGLQGTPKEIVDEFVSNIVEARKHLPEN